MLGFLFDSNERQIKKLRPIVAKINTFEEGFAKFSKEEIKAKTSSWKEILYKLDFDSQKKYLEEILPEAFALVREAGKRALNMRHFDVQLMAGIILHEGKIAEQKTGEGKTLTATLAIYLNALTGKGVHLVTPNDYLSRHGAGWMGTLYDYLGLTTGVIMQQRAFKFDSSYNGTEFEDSYSTHLKEVAKQVAYQCDVTYGTNHEFGFDYLRDNMVSKFSEMVQTNPLGEWGTHYFAIVDEVDSILIDVARTPLIISTTAEQPTERYNQANGIIKQLIKGTDYEVDEKFRSATLTDLGIRRVEKMLGIGNLYEQDFEMVHLVEQSLSAFTLYEKDRDYVVKDGQVVIVDQFTGRLLPSNRYSQGLHQAIEAKEGVTIQQESKTLAEVSYQNYFRMYSKLAGMTGTAVTEAEEFYKIYKLDVVVVPTNKPVTRTDFQDVVYKTESAKYRAVAEDVAEKYSRGQPVLIGTTSVDKSQLVHEQLKRRGIPHQILNAKNHDKEALIIAQAGKKSAVTVSTNMAGRGVDILLGGDQSASETTIEEAEVKEISALGGLHVIGTERHESRRIDNQLRGRAGRQGDPGSSRFFVSLQDDLMRIFGGAQVEKLMDRFGLDENTPLESSIVTSSIANAQKRVEGFNFDRRKQLVEMDDVMNTHREVVYKLRRIVLQLVEKDESAGEWLLGKLQENIDFDTKTNWDDHVARFGLGSWLQIVASLALPVINVLWSEHLVDMDHIRDGIGLRGYAQRDPMVEYKREGHERFEMLVQKIYLEIVERLENVTDQVAKQIELDKVANTGKSKKAPELKYTQGDFESGVSTEAGEIKQTNFNNAKNGGRNISVEPVISNKNAVGRNDMCPCGSGKKYKNCGLINAPDHKK
ncbi:preprotein translocase subunit SecA [candidate division WWE3 bacterium]|nr:preprotein translocase subunit SecA [candidate division WWE3 bacterium]